MLRKAGHIFFSLLLLVSTTGFAISKHYCGGELVSTSIFTEAESCCDSGDCCKNETELIQVEVDYSIVPVLDMPETAQIDLLVLSLVVFNISFEESTTPEEFVFADLPPPPKIQTALAIRQSYLL